MSPVTVVMAYVREYPQTLFALALLCSFLPFMGGLGVTLSGVRLIHEAISEPVGENGSAFLFLVPFLAAIAGLAFGFARGRKRWMGGIVAGSVGTVMFLLIGLGAAIGPAQGAHLSIGYYLMLLFFIGALALNISLLREAKRHAWTVQGGPGGVGLRGVAERAPMRPVTGSPTAGPASKVPVPGRPPPLPTVMDVGRPCEPPPLPGASVVTPVTAGSASGPMPIGSPGGMPPIPGPPPIPIGSGSLTGRGGPAGFPAGMFGIYARTFSPATFGLVLFCFFLPFVHVTCRGERAATFSGIQLVVGTKVSDSDMGTGMGMPRELRDSSLQKVGPEVWAVLAFLTAVGGLAVSFIKDRRGWMGGVMAGSAGAIMLLLLKLEIDRDAMRESREAVKEFGRELGSGLLDVQYAGGFYLTILLFIGAAALHGYLLLEAKKQHRMSGILP